MPPEQYQPPVPPVGLPVQWFPHANRDETVHAATVLGYSNTQAVIIGFIPARGQARRITSVRYIEDPFFERAEQQYRNDHGAWGFVPGFSVAESEELRQAHSKIRGLFAEGKGTPEIAAELGGDWTHQKVHAYLRKQNLKK